MVTREDRSSLWFETLGRRICGVFEGIEDEFSGRGLAGRFKSRTWKRSFGDGEGDGGGGTMNVMHGRVFEKVGVNFSTVYGVLDPTFAGQVQGVGEDGMFWASGLSLVAHMCSPLVPAAHMNTRHIKTTREWFGGGSDLTPIYPHEPDTQDFHTALKQVCDQYDTTYYPCFKDWCDRYFYLVHRQESRGVGGIFFDDLQSGDWERDFSFICALGETFLRVYVEIIRRHMHEPWTKEQREYQLVRRGRYVEFNLLYDRGTAFGLKTGAYTDAIFMSLPPMVSWP